MDTHEEHAPDKHAAGHDRPHTLPPPPPLTEEERDRALAYLAELDELRAAQRRARGGRPHRSTTIDIRAIRSGLEFLDAVIAVHGHLRAAQAALGHDAMVVARELAAALAVVEAEVPVGAVPRNPTETGAGGAGAL